MIRVRVFTEDRTGGGLEALIQAETRDRRNAAGCQPLGFLPSRRINGADQLLKAVEAYQEARFSVRPRPDHVLYVMDAKECWGRLDLATPRPPYSPASLGPSLEQARARMKERAQRRTDPKLWGDLQSGCHCHLLVWERESVVLPVADRLGLGDAKADAYEVVNAFQWVKGRAHERDTERRGFSKSTGTIHLLKMIANDDELRRLAVQANGSLGAIVDTLVAL